MIKIPAKAAHISDSNMGVREGRDPEKHPFPEMPATRIGFASTKQGKGCLRTPERQGKTKFLAKIVSQRGSKGLRSKKARLESEISDFSWSYQTLTNDLASGTMVKIKLKKPNNCSISFLETD